MGGSRELAIPVQLAVGNTTIVIRPSGPGSGAAAPARAAAAPPPAAAPPRALQEMVTSFPGLHETTFLTEESPPPGLATIAQPVRRSSNRIPAVALPDLKLGEEKTSPEVIAQWLESVLALQRDATNAAEIHEATARALVTLIGLDVGLVLLRRGAQWRPVARVARDENQESRGREFSTTILNHVVKEKKTFYQDLGALTSQESLRNVDAVVVSPVFGLNNEEVVGVVYGMRRTNPRLGPKAGGIKPLEAHLVQLLAATVGATLARAEATKTRTQFEQFFSAELTRELERDPNLLEGQEREVTILMSDVRGFSSLSEKLGPANLCRLIRDVMEQLSNRIVEYGGTIVNYLGDGILAMWNAPANQDQHPVLACKAALAMQREMPALSERWRAMVGGPLAIGIGINTGPAQVGNTGSSRRLMYGPLGHTVNLASRVEGATKQLGVKILVTHYTRSRIGEEFALRRLCKVRVVGIGEAVELFELAGEGGQAAPEWATLRSTYETALTQFEGQQFAEGIQTLMPLWVQAQDKATLRLFHRLIQCRDYPEESFDPVLELTSK
jgi:adenylate cyclase